MGEEEIGEEMIVVDNMCVMWCDAYMYVHVSGAEFKNRGTKRGREEMGGYDMGKCRFFRDYR